MHERLVSQVKKYFFNSCSVVITSAGSGSDVRKLSNQNRVAIQEEVP